MNRLLNLGIISCLMIIFLHILIESFSILGHGYIKIFIGGFNSLFDIIILITLWRILVKLYGQTQLDTLLKLMISTSIILSILSVGYLFIVGKIIYTIISVLSVINLILYFIFINQIAEIDKSDISQIEQLKNYGLSFIICLFGLIIFEIIIAFNRIKNLKFIEHNLMIIPVIFIGIFFFKTLKSLKTNK